LSVADFRKLKVAGEEKLFFIGNDGFVNYAEALFDDEVGYEALGANLYSLGACFLKFMRLLAMDIPVIDPSLYIHRFAQRMDLGASVHTVAMTAVRLVARMKRDWIETGRRPAGICGACLLVGTVVVDV
jgi:transcription initiation factor TFIIIB Brf1 subunit/transcription initiation factor TFIIB